LSYVFDEEYERLKDEVNSVAHSFDKLIFLNNALFSMIEERIDLDLLTRLYSTQLITKGEKHLLDHNRIYYKILRKIVSEGQSKGEITTEMSINEIVKLYAMCERALLYDWCLCNGEYSLKKYANFVMPMFLEKIKI
ncbi:MAG: TetR/AcrR family transcriptional regulator, partial [Clostridia bacterium]|nr:TetR/AcrR family transcriptional regulator [Clostridia bacterium]